MPKHVTQDFFYIFKDCIDKIHECLDICKEINKTCITSEKEKPLAQCVQSLGKCLINFDLLIAACEKCVDFCNAHLNSCKDEDCSKICNKVVFACQECINFSEECLAHCEENETQVSVDKCQDFVAKGIDCIEVCKQVIEFMANKN